MNWEDFQIAEGIYEGWERAANDELAEHKKLTLPAGSLLMSATESLVLSSPGMVLYGSGTKIIKKSSLAVGDGKLAIIQMIGDGCTVKDLRIVDAGTLQVGSIETSGDDQKIINVMCSGGYSGIWVKNGKNLLLSGCICERSAHPIYLGGWDEVPSDTSGFLPANNIDGVVIENCVGRYANVGGDGLKFTYRVKNVFVRGCTFEGNAQDGIDFFGSGENIVIRDCILRKNLYQGCDIKTDEARYPSKIWGNNKNIQIIQCQISDNGLNGVKVWRPGEQREEPRPENVVVAGCIIAGNKKCGIISRTGINIEKNIIESNERGIYMLGISSATPEDLTTWDHLRGGVVVGNTLRKNKISAIHCNGAIETIISENLILEAPIGIPTSWGISAYDSEVFLKSNVICESYPIPVENRKNVLNQESSQSGGYSIRKTERTWDEETEEKVLPFTLDIIPTEGEKYAIQVGINFKKNEDI